MLWLFPFESSWLGQDALINCALSSNTSLGRRCKSEVRRFFLSPRWLFSGFSWVKISYIFANFNLDWIFSMFILKLSFPELLGEVRGNIFEHVSVILLNGRSIDYSSDFIVESTTASTSGMTSSSELILLSFLSFSAIKRSNFSVISFNCSSYLAFYITSSAFCFLIMETFSSSSGFGFLDIYFSSLSFLSRITRLV